MFDPPEFANLADRPELRAAVRALFDDAVRWTDEQLRARPRFGDHLIRGVAEQTASTRGVDLGRLNGCAVIVPVEGLWWRRCAPGAVVCSMGVAADPGTARAALADAFASGLAG